MKRKLLLTLIIALSAPFAFAGDILLEGFEYGNHDLVKPIGWTCADGAWLCGYQEKDHNRIPHEGDWYAFSNGDDAWMFMQLYLISGLQYRFSCWAIADGSGQLEVWAGTSPSSDDMHTLLLSVTVGSDGYQKVTNYVETIPEGCVSVYAQFCPRSPKFAEIQAALKAADVPTARYYPIPMHLLGATEYLGYKKGDMPVSEACAADIFALPMHPYLKAEDIDRICGVIADTVKA